MVWAVITCPTRLHTDGDPIIPRIAPGRVCRAIQPGTTGARPPPRAAELVEVHKPEIVDNSFRADFHLNFDLTDLLIAVRCAAAVDFPDRGVLWTEPLELSRRA